MVTVEIVYKLADRPRDNVREKLRCGKSIQRLPDCLIGVPEEKEKRIERGGNRRKLQRTKKR